LPGIQKEAPLSRVPGTKLAGLFFLSYIYLNSIVAPPPANSRNPLSRVR
jgi:hypothetical protein